jgi:hypothetical protein
MSIVPKEVVASIAAAWNLECGETFAAHIANHVAEWAFEQAAQVCDAQARLDYDAYDLTGNAYSEGAAGAADGLATKLRAMTKGGESDGQ